MYSIDTNFFSNITTELQSYLLAWFWSRGSGHIQVRLSDINSLNLISSSLGYSGPIHIYKNVADLNITNKIFKQHLFNIGCVKNIKQSQTYPLISDHLVSHFLRGIYDNYGTLFLCKKKYPNITITYNETFLFYFCVFCANN